jgi:hypothetical protein
MRVKRTSQGAEPFPYWIFKQCSFELGPIIIHLYNLILSTSVSLVSWKHSLVTPIPKVTPPRYYSDLRPISVTPILSRIYGKLFVKKFLLKPYPITSSMINLHLDLPEASQLRCLICFLRQLMLLNMAIILYVCLLTLVKLSTRYLITNYQAN